MTENNKEEVLESYKQFCSKIKKQIKALISGESIKYKNDFMKIRVNSFDELSLNKILYLPVLDIIQIFNEYYPQIYINECEYECE